MNAVSGLRALDGAAGDVKGLGPEVDWGASKLHLVGSRSSKKLQNAAQRRCEASWLKASSPKRSVRVRRRSRVPSKAAPVPKQPTSVAVFADHGQHHNLRGAKAVIVLNREKAPLTFAVMKCRAEPAKTTFEPGIYC